MELTIKEWKDLFHIDGIDIVDEMDWNPYALAEGLADDSTPVELSIVQIANLSPLSSKEIERIIKALK